MSFGRTFVLLSVLVVGTGSPAFAVKTGGGGVQCLPGQVQHCTLGPPPVCTCSGGTQSKKSSVTSTRQGGGATQGNGNVNTGNKGAPSSGKKH